MHISLENYSSYLNIIKIYNKTKIIVNLIRYDAPLKRSFKSGFTLYLWYGIIRENNETSTVHLHRNSLCSIKTQRHCSTFVDENWIRRL